MSKNKMQIKRLAGMASLIAIVVVLQIISNYVTIAGISMTLSLIPIAVGAILYGPIAGLILGLVMGALVLTAPSTISIFFSVAPFGTILVCLLKGGMAGLISGLAFKYIKKYSFTGALVTAAMLTPLVNTTLFLVVGSIFFQKAYETTSYLNCFVVIFGYVWLQMTIEIAINAIMSPSLCQLVRVLGRNYDLGFNLDMAQIEEKEENKEA